MFTQKQIQELLSILDNQKLVFIGRNLGPDYLTQGERDRLKSIGVNVNKMYIPSNDPIRQAMYFGILSDVIDGAKSVKLKDVKKYLQSKQYIPLNTSQKATLDSIKRQYMGDIRAHGSKVFSDVNNIINEKEKQKRPAYEKVIRDEVKRGVQKKNTVEEIARELGHKTGDWNRDFDRIVQCMTHLAFDEGRAAQYERAGGEDALVFKDVYPGACKHCIRLYLTGGIGSKPKIFKLSELRANGTNIGKKVKDWKPVVGFTHPYCRCTLNFFDKDKMDWDEESSRFKRKGKVTVRGRKPIRTVFKGKEYFV